MKSKINLFIAGAGLLVAVASKAQTLTYSTGSTNIYLNPTNKTFSIGTASVPLAGVRLDVAGGAIRTNANPILLGVDNFHGVAFYGTGAPYFTSTGPFANQGVDGPVLFGYEGGALGSNLNTVKNIALRWRSNGNVGIGESNPLARLHITSPAAENSLDIWAGGICNFRVKSTGYVYARDLTVQAGTFPDYVFAKDYKLMSLSDVNSFIKKYNHLPEMPTASEVEKDGMSVSKINTLLVQKVEELTLYIIKLQEEVDQLKK